MNRNSRRRFLKLGAQTMAGAGLALGGDPMLTLARAADSGFNTFTDYRALVCIYLQGGSDGFSLLVPTGSAEYNEYRQSRQDLAIPQGQLLNLTGSGNATTDTLGLHPAASALQPLYDSGDLAMIANVGNLIEPTTVEQYENNSVQLPAQLFSHSDQEIQWQQLQGRDSGTVGWGALAAEHLAGYQERDYLTAITLAGSNYWQSGSGQRPFSLSESGVIDYSGMDDPSNDWQRPRIDAFRNIMAQQRSNVFSSAYADVQNRAMTVTAELGAVLESNASLVADAPPESDLAARLALVAQLIGAQEQLGLHRQVFYVRMGGWDVHDQQNQDLPELFAELADAMAFFQNTLDQMGQSNNVTTFTASDFGRTLTGNGDGTDHGWGNHLMAMGGAVLGGEVYGSAPRLSVDGPDSVHNGRVLPTLSASQYAATLLCWLGLDEQQLHSTLPNLGNFATQDLGFLMTS